MLQAESQQCKRSQRSICDRIHNVPGSIYMIYNHQDLQIKRNSFSAKVRDKWCHKRRHNLLMTLRSIGYMHCLTRWSGRCWKFKIEKNSKSELVWYQNVPHVLNKKIASHTWCFCSQIRKLEAFELLKWAALSEWKSQRWSKKRYSENTIVYFILSSEINAYQKQIKVISITSGMIWYQSLVIDISLYFHSSVFWITSDFSIHLMQLTLKVQTPITFLFVNKNIKCG